MTKKLLIKYLYIYLCKTYQHLVGCYEKIALKHTFFKKEFENKGVLQLENINIDISDIINTPKKDINKYSSSRILKYNQIIELINKVFTHEIKKQITEITGFKYTIDYLIFYDRQYINKNDLYTDNGALSVLNQWYAYKWHFDKPNSTNMLKIILPISIEDDESALAVINKDKSKQINVNNETMLSNVEKNYFKGQSNKLYGFNPTVCIHRDGIPAKGKTATQIMFQLNPSRHWKLNKEIYKKQMKREPKFPLLAYLYDKKIKF